MLDNQESIKQDNRPLYNQAIDGINKFIKQNNYLPGQKLPSEGELSKKLGISRPTLREAMGHLEAQGIIERRHGVGTFVISPAQGMIHGGIEKLESLLYLSKKLGIPIHREDWVVQIIDAPGKIAVILELGEQAKVCKTQMTVSTDGVIFAYLENYIAPDFIEMNDLQGYEKGSLLDYLIEKQELKLSYTHTNLYAVESKGDLLRWLKTDETKPLMLLSETYFTSSGKPVSHECNYFLTDYFNFHITRRIIRW
jgi:GntR family transcriptional regulator